jgi:hypothetical protein
MVNHVVLHLRKIITKNGVKEVLRHNLREKDNLEKFIDITKSHYNFYSGATVENFSEIYEEFCANLPRKIQRNASRGIETVISFSHEYGEGWETDQNKHKNIIAYFNQAEKFLTEWFGIKNFSRTDHMDEKTPHSHLLFVPLCKNKDGILRFSSSDFLGKRKNFFALHDNFYLRVGKFFNLERGIRDSRTPHLSLKYYSEWEKEQRLNIANEKDELERKKKELEEEKTRIDLENDFLENQKKNIFDRMGEYFKKFDKVSLKEREFEQFEKDLRDQIPQIDIPPTLVTENQKKAYKDKTQGIINNAFERAAKGFQSIKMKFNDLKNNYDDLLEKCKSFYNRMIKAEDDLQNKPIKEIETEREVRLKEKQEQKDGIKINKPIKIGL